MSVGRVYYLKCDNCHELLEIDDCPFFYDKRELYKYAVLKKWPVREVQIAYALEVLCPKCFTEIYGTEHYEKVCKDIVESDGEEDEQ